MTLLTEGMVQAQPRRFRPYSAYRTLTDQWLGHIPAHWKAGRLKYLATINDEALPESTDPGFEISYVDIGNVDAVAGLVGMEAIVFEKAPSRARRIVRRGDVIVSTVRTYLRAIAAIEAPEPNLIVSTGFAVIRPRQLESHFAAYALRAPHFVERVVANSLGVSYPAISASSLACFEIAYPQICEQRMIAVFLDSETAKIDALVARKERLIELLQEKRAALVTRAVTRGLDPTVPTKDSGVEWLGEIPAHWEPTQLWRLASAMSGATPPKENIAYWDGEIPWVTPKDMKRRVIATSEVLITQRALDETGIKLVRPQVVLVVVRGMILAHSFPVAVTTVPVTVNQDMKALRLTDDVDPSYFAWSLDGLALGIIATVVDEAAHGTRVIRMDQWRNLVCPVPPYPEQCAIAEFLDRETAKIDALIAKIRQAIDHLKEYRTALISAAVTGKIDVREMTR